MQHAIKGPPLTSVWAAEGPDGVCVQRGHTTAGQPDHRVAGRIFAVDDGLPDRCSGALRSTARSLAGRQLPLQAGTTKVPARGLLWPRARWLAVREGQPTWWASTVWLTPFVTSACAREGSASSSASGCWSRVLARAYLTSGTRRPYREGTRRFVVHGHESRGSCSCPASGPVDRVSHGRVSTGHSPAEPAPAGAT